MTPTVFAVLLLLISVNALYVAAEFSAVTVRRSRIRQKAEEGHRLARALLPYIQSPRRLDRYVAACQIGITISSLVLGAYGQAALAPAVAPLFQELGGMGAIAAYSAAAAVVLVTLTGFQMILGELAPKSVALQYPTALALYTVMPMRWSLRLFSWFIVVLNGSGVAVLRMLGFRDTGHRHIHSPEEIEYMIAESREGGMLEPTEHERLRKALRLNAIEVEEIMVPRTRVRAVDVETPFDELIREVAESPYTRMPVYEGSMDRILGILHVQDVARRSLDGGESSVRSLLRPVPVVPEGLSAERVLQRLRVERQHLAIVVDEFGGTAGLVTVGDVLDEIFGGIASELGADELGPERLPDGRLRLPGRMRVEEAGKWTGADWTGEAHTVGGLIMERLGRIAEPGDRLEIGGASVTVERVRRRAVESVLARPRPGGREAGDG